MTRVSQNTANKHATGVKAESLKHIRSFPFSHIMSHSAVTSEKHSVLNTKKTEAFKTYTS